MEGNVSGQVYHDVYDIPLYDLTYHVILSAKDIHFATMTAGVIFPGTTIDVKGVPGWVGVLEHPQKKTQFVICLDLSYYDDSNIDEPSKNIGNVTKYATELSWKMLKHLNIKVDFDNNVTQCYLVEFIVNDILFFLESVGKDKDESNNENNNDSIDDL